jgi:hypothetical protein
MGIVMMMVACSKTEEKPKTVAQQLADRLLTLQQKGYMWGIRTIRSMALRGNTNPIVAT